MKKHPPILTTVFSLCVFCFVLAVAPAQAANLIGWWKFNEGSGTTSADSSGNGSTATISGATWSTDAHEGGSLYFDGTNDLVAIADGAWNKAAPVTFACWYKRQASTGGGNTVFEHVYAGAIKGVYSCWQTASSGPGSLTAFSAYDNTLANVGVSSAPLPAGVWTHVAVTVSGTDIKMYEDGVLKSTTAISGFPKQAGSLYIGGRGEVPDQYLKGWIDDMRVYDGVLSASEILALAAPIPQPSSLIGWWKFNEGSGTTTADSSGNGNTAIITGATWSTDAHEGKSLYFDGVNDLVSISDGTWNKAAPVTFIAWYKRQASATSGNTIFEHGCTGAIKGVYSCWQTATGGPGSLTAFVGYDNTLANVGVTSAPMPEGEWTQVAVTVSPTEMKMYEDGILKSTTAISGFPKQAGSLYIGGRGEVPDQYFKGWIDDMQVYDRVLNADEIRVLGSVRIPKLAWNERSDWINIKTDVTPAAVGDGVTDDTAAIQAALDVPGFGNTVYFPPGTYKVTSTLNLTAGVYHFPVRLIGHGRDTKLVWYGTAGGNFFNVDSNPYGRYVGLVLDGRNVAANGFYHNNTTWFETSIRHQHVGFYNFTNAGVFLVNTDVAATAETSYENCIFDHCGIGVALRDFNDLNHTFVGCDFIACGVGIYCSHGCFYARQCYFNGSTWSDIAGEDGWANAEHNCSVRFCKSTGSRQFIRFAGSVSDGTFMDCHVTGWTGPDGAIGVGDKPPFVANCTFLNPPDTNAPIRTWSRRFIGSNNSAPSSSTLVAYSYPAVSYTVPTGTVAPIVSGSATNLATFINQSVTVPTNIFDAKTGYGAVGDGSTDDTTAVQNCINAARAAGNGAVAYIPKGKYKITSTLNVTGANYVIGGGGYYAMLHWGGTAGGTLMKVTDPSNISIEDVLIGSAESGAQNNAVDIEQVSTGSTSRMIYDGVYVYGKYAGLPETKGLRLNGLGSNCTVLLRFIEGNLRFLNSANATILGNITYEGGMVVEHTGTTRNGFLGIQTRMTTMMPGARGLTLRNNNSIVMSDWYSEGTEFGMLLSGTTGDPAGRVVIGALKINSSGNPGANFLHVDNYQGKIILGPCQFYVDPTVQTADQTGSRPVDITLFGSTFYNCSLATTGSSYAFVGNDITWTGTAPADSYTSSTLSDITLSIDDVERMGRLDFQENFSHLTW